MKKNNKFYSVLLMILFAAAAIANTINAGFFSGHNNFVIQKISLTFSVIILLDIALILLHYDFYKKNKRPSTWLQIFLTVSTILLAVINISLLIR